MTSRLATELLDFAIDVAVDAGQLLIAHLDEVLDVDMKTSATDPVTQADRASESLLSRRVHEFRPDDGFLGEEAEHNREGTSGIRWVVDPLDATVNFTYANPHWCVSVAAEDADGAVCGVVHDPLRRELFTAARGHGAYCNGRPINVSQVGELSNTLVATGFAYDPDVRAEQGPLIAGLLPQVRDIRRSGSAALDLAYVAAGRVDAYVEFALQPWDWAAGRLLVTEAGGVVSPRTRTFAGQPLDGMVAGGAQAHDNLAAWLEGVS